MLKVKGYVKENWGSPFCCGVHVAFDCCRCFLVCRLVSLANTVAVYAYYALVAGVFLQFASFLKYCGKSNDEVAV